MTDARKLMLVVGQTPEMASHGSRNSRDGSRCRSTKWFAGDAAEERDTMSDLARGPARGIVLALVPGLLVWAGLIELALKVVR